MKYVIANNSLVDFNESYSSYSGKIQNRPYTHYLVKKSLDISLNIWCLDNVLNYITPADDVSTVVEYFAGLGIDTHLLRYRLNPTKHICIDLDQSCIDILRNTLHGQVQIVRDDFYCVAGKYEADLAVLDFETYTILKLTAKEFDALRRVFQSSKLVVLVDTACAKIWLNYDAYTKELREPITDMRSYFQVLSNYYARNFGWIIQVAVMHNRAAYTLMRPVHGQVQDVILVQAPNSIGKSYFRKL